MIRQLRKYLDKLSLDGSARPDRIALLARDDQLLSLGADDLLPLGDAVIEQLNVISLVLATPPLPFLELLLGRVPQNADHVVPLDTETRTFLHDIPLVRRHEYSVENPARLIEMLGQRKGILVEGIGIIATGSVTVEQAYINYSSIYHALFIKVLLMLLTDRSPPTQLEMTRLQPLWAQLSVAIPRQVDDLLPGPLDEKTTILKAMDEAGKRTVELQLVDSFFGNISCNNRNSIFISQTGASLDELPGCIDLVPNDNSSTAGITASSELIAHRAIYQRTKARTILHGHPKFSVILSLFCQETDCNITDCWKNCDKVRHLGSVPVVAGEVGAGGIARKVPPVIGSGIAVVYGHGVFATGDVDFRQPLAAMIKLENWCRQEYYQTLLQRCRNENQEFQ
ncbi:MAG: class II aldolase/adducin family protein [Desulfuromonadales bacterium]|nr:class II aldolase/adducin family protein [Desulfuromonadales bacterium]